MFIDDSSRAYSLRICGPNRELPRGIGNGGSNRFGALWYTAEVLRDEARLLAMVVPGGVENAEGQARRCVLVEGQASVPNKIVVLAEVLDADQGVERERNLDRERTLPRRENGSEWVIISERTVKAGSTRVEFEDLALADIGLQVVTCQRVKKELVESILESLCDAWRETLGRRQQ